MPDTGSTLANVTDFISNLSSQGAAWYRGLTGNPVVVPATNPQIAAQQQIAINQAAQASLTQSNPTLAGILANPTVIVVMGLLALALIIYLVRKS